MSWPEFFEWLLANGFLYTHGDVHYAGSGHWFPVLPDTSTGDENPHPPEPWIHIIQDRGNQAVFVEASYGPGAYATTTELAQEHVIRLLLDYDTALGADPLIVPPPRFAPEPPIPEYVPRAQTSKETRWYDETRERLERAWQAKHGPTIERGRVLRELEAKRRAAGEPYVLPPYKDPSLDGFAAPVRGGSIDRFITRWVDGTLGRKEKEGPLSVRVDGPVSALYSYAVPIASILGRQYIVVSTSDALARTSPTTNAHLRVVAWAIQDSQTFPVGQQAIQTAGRVPLNEHEWESALVAFDARNEGRPTYLRGT